MSKSCNVVWQVSGTCSLRTAYKVWTVDCAVDGNENHFGTFP